MAAIPDPRIKSFLEANKAWATSPTFESPIPFLEMQKRGRGRPDGTVIVGRLPGERRRRPTANHNPVSCCDPRLNTEQTFGIGTGMSSEFSLRGNFAGCANGRVSAATIVRSAGGRVHTVLDSLLVLNAVGNEGKKGLIIVVHHTGKLSPNFIIYLREVR
jgi:carbonic anhydrase